MTLTLSGYVERVCRLSHWDMRRVSSNPVRCFLMFLDSVFISGLYQYVKTACYILAHRCWIRPQYSECWELSVRLRLHARHWESAPKTSLGWCLLVARAWYMGELRKIEWVSWADRCSHFCRTRAATFASGGSYISKVVLLTFRVPTYSIDILSCWLGCIDREFYDSFLFTWGIMELQCSNLFFYWHEAFSHKLAFLVNKSLTFTFNENGSVSSW
jgi:hypothetical protein